MDNLAPEGSGGSMGVIISPRPVQYAVPLERKNVISEPNSADHSIIYMHRCKKSEIRQQGDVSAECIERKLASYLIYKKYTVDMHNTYYNINLT